jgi:hypothetical protein
VLCRIPVSVAVSREGWVTLIAPKPAGMIVWAKSGRGKEKAKSLKINLVFIF